MPYLMRVELPDVPGSLGRVASAIGEAGGDIEAIEIVEKRDGYAVDDVLLEIPTGTMPDSVVSACSVLDGVSVLWINRYAAGGNLFLDLEVVEALTEDPASARDRLVDLLPIAFRVDWAARVRPGASGATVVHATDAAPESFDLPPVTAPVRLPGSDTYVECAAPLGGDVLLMGRRGGPEFLDSELARLEHLLGLAVTISGT
ncbi:ACT domain-containing protein [Nocardioides okcheonensis]|uniref:ACT domain-containing protein n=1 Tax=Nocardioides okcheonensis TaxID=2894081 RepID=UPI001E356B42|nr:ACT domain-containing protein [Nocardioides okcheonensis]UFN43212.1 ACT domain-containing protein [Nocardioides okcheonensis]